MRNDSRLDWMCLPCRCCTCVSISDSCKQSKDTHDNFDDFSVDISTTVAHASLAITSW